MIGFHDWSSYFALCLLILVVGITAHDLIRTRAKNRRRLAEMRARRGR